MAALANNEILVLDDDDFYPPENVISRVKTSLSENKECVGCSKTYVKSYCDQTFEAFDPSDDDPLLYYY